MKNNLFRLCLLASFATLIVACSPKQEEPVAAVAIDKDAIFKEIQAKENAFADIYNTRELRDIGYYADDAISFSQNKEALVGKPAIVAYMIAGLESTDPGNRMSFTTKEIFVSNDGNQVVELGYYSFVDSAKVPINTGNYMVLFEKRNGSYVVVRDMSASDMPLD